MNGYLLSRSFLPRNLLSNKCILARSGSFSSANKVSKARVQESLSSQKVTAAASDGDWVRIYRFPLIVPLRAFSRFKIWQTAAALGLTPFVLSAYQHGALSAEFAVGSLVGAGLATATLYVISYFSRNLIGIVSVNRNDDTVRIGRLTFWGRRVNDIFPQRDVIPLEDIGENPSDVWWRVYRYSNKNQPYFIILRFGGVDQPDIFRSVFGSSRG